MAGTEARCVTRDAERFDGYLAGPQGGAKVPGILAVHPDRHRQGIGRALLTHAERWRRGRGAAMFYVMTLGPSDPYAPYANTRAFYASFGFRPLFETTARWGPENPALVLAKPISGTASDDPPRAPE